jgi:hypothetical protein
MYIETLSEQEKSILNNYSKVIVWGFPLHTHTHSYIHAMWIKVFNEGFGKDTYWFHDDDFPSSFDYTNSIFITEGYADKNIPIVMSSVYFVHNAIYPEKYLNKNVRLIEIRFNVMEIHDVNNDFKLDDGTHNDLIYLSEETKYEKLYSNKDLHVSKRGNEIKQMNYECIYLYWATDLFPHEFDFDNIPDKQNPVIYYIGSNAISTNLHKFKEICQKNKIQWIQNNPWVSPVSFEENRRLMKLSLLCPDFRSTGTLRDIEEFGLKNGKNHMEIGYLPCRVLKAISYGHLGITDCVHIKNILKEHVVFHDNMEILFQMAISERNNKERIKNAMKHVQEKHTYVHRARDLIRAILQ